MPDILGTCQKNLSIEQMTEKEREQAKVDGFNAAPGDLNKRDGYHCTLCNNKGYIGKLYEDNGRYSMVAVECKCKTVRSSIRKMNKSGLQDVIKNYTFESWQAEKEWQVNIKAKAMAYAESPVGWFYIGGQPGCGKTHLCTAICRKFLLDNKGVRYMQWREEVAKLKEFSTEPEKRQSVLEDFKTAEVLYIDDLFKCGRKPDGSAQRPTSADINIAFEILNYRYNKPDSITIISSELAAQEVIDIDEAIGSRIYERSNPIRISKDITKNYRMKKEIIF